MNDAVAWLALVISLPARNATARTRVWRSLKALGCGVLRDGVYLLPDGAAAREALAGEAKEVIAAGGSANLVGLVPLDDAQTAAWRRLFDRTADYAGLMDELRRLRSALKPSTAARLGRRLAALRRGFEETSRVDFFPGTAREQARGLLDETAQTFEELLSPDEPRSVARAIARLRRQDYQNRLWATRRRPWVDRLASAWLIVRFIDRRARFRWLAKPQDCPARAVGFDFDGAQFTHVGNRVTFEVLLAAFNLEADAALARIAQAVHFLDAGGVPVADAAGLKTVLTGARNRAVNDDELLAEALKIFDYLYSAYKEETHARD
jgi:hypothetical protein